MNSPLAYTISEACIVARAGRTSLYEAIRDGALIARKRGRKTLILADDLRDWIEHLPTIESKTTDRAYVKAIADTRARPR
jgi:excisionase family DNA binding protein